MQKKNILLIGAGAVGLVYGKHLEDAGHSVTFLIKEKHRKALADGTVLYHLNKDKSRSEPIHWKGYQLIDRFEEVKAHLWDQVYLCFSSTALQVYDFNGLNQHLKGSPTIVMLQPSAEDYHTLLKTFPAEQIVEGMITLISYSTPMASENTAIPGTAYWFPPMMPTPFSGTPDRRDEVITQFRLGGIKAKATDSVRMEALFPSAFLGTFLIALEASDWNFKKMRKDGKLLKQLQQALEEVFTALEAKYAAKRPMGFGLMGSPMVIKLLLRLAPVVMPMDIETYFEAHFTKVNSQTKLYLSNHLATAREMGTPHQMIQHFHMLT